MWTEGLDSACIRVDFFFALFAYGLLIKKIVRVIYTKPHKLFKPCCVSEYTDGELDQEIRHLRF